MTPAVAIEQCLTRDAMDRVAMSIGSNLDADLLPDGVEKLANALTTYVLENLPTLQSVEDQPEGLYSLVASNVQKRIKEECNCIPQDPYFPDIDNGGGLVSIFQKFITWLRS